MRNLKKSIVTIMAGIMIFLAASSTIEAKNITSLNATAANGKITVSGTAEAGTLACAVLVYDETETNLLSMETCGVAADSTYSYTLGMKFANATYVVKVADYDGGSYTTTKVTVSGSTSAGTETQASSETKVSPKTGDVNPIAGVFTLILIAGAGVVLTSKKKAN